MCEPCVEGKMKDFCDELRGEIRRTAEKVHCMLSHSDFKAEETYCGQHGEMKANIMLSFRHLEDARMRIGKALQAAGDGVSIFDKSLNSK